MSIKKQKIKKIKKYIYNFLILWGISLVGVSIYFYETMKLEWIKEYRDPIDRKYIYDYRNDTLYHIYTITTNSDIETLLEYYDSEDRDIFNYDFHETALPHRFGKTKYDIMAYYNDSSIALFRKRYKSRPNKDPIIIHYVPAMFLHDTLPEKFRNDSLRGWHK